jgi:hypothetical protein
MNTRKRQEIRQALPARLQQDYDKLVRDWRIRGFKISSMKFLLDHPLLIDTKLTADFIDRMIKDRQPPIDPVQLRNEIQQGQFTELRNSLFGSVKQLFATIKSTTTEANQSGFHHVAELPQCAICLQQIGGMNEMKFAAIIVDALGRPTCTGVYCFDCLLLWYLKNPQCPICRQAFDLTEIRWKALTTTPEPTKVVTNVEEEEETLTPEDAPSTPLFCPHSSCASAILVGKYGLYCSNRDLHYCQECAEHRRKPTGRLQPYSGIGCKISAKDIKKN